MNRSSDPFSRFLRTKSLLLLVILIAGCGVQQYEERLNESRKYYTYLDNIEKTLAPKWMSPGGAIEIRVPNQFTAIPAPVPVKDENGQIQEPKIDPRQPAYLNMDFPGLFGAWVAPFRVNGAGGSEDLKGYIYVLSNYYQLAGNESKGAVDFVKNLESFMRDKLQIETSDVRVELHPKSTPSYQPQQTYNAFSFKQKEINGTNYTFDVYSRSAGSVIGVVVVVLPEGIEMPQKVLERIPMMLELFNFTSTPPAGPPPPTGAGAQPSQSTSTSTGF